MGEYWLCRQEMQGVFRKNLNNVRTGPLEGAKGMQICKGMATKPLCARFYFAFLSFKLCKRVCTRAAIGIVQADVFNFAGFVHFVGEEVGRQKILADEVPDFFGLGRLNIQEAVGNNSHLVPVALRLREIDGELVESFPVEFQETEVPFEHSSDRALEIGREQTDGA